MTTFLAVTLTSISVAVGIVAAVIGGAMSVPEYRLKAQTQRAALDVELSRLFTELVPIAAGRGPAVLSEAVVSQLVKEGDLTNREIASRAMIPGTVGSPTQAAALTSLAVLGRNYPVLRDPARAALNDMGFLEGDMARVRSDALNMLP